MADECNNENGYVTGSRTQATIGSSIVIKGEISGSEDLVIEGTLEGSVNLKENTVTIGNTAKVAANITAQKIRVQGEVQGDLVGKEMVIVESSGKVLGNITSPRLSLEEGARLKGAIDTDPQNGEERVAVSVSSETANGNIPARKEQESTSVTEVEASNIPPQTGEEKKPEQAVQ